MVFALAISSRSSATGASRVPVRVNGSVSKDNERIAIHFGVCRLHYDMRFQIPHISTTDKSISYV